MTKKELTYAEKRKQLIISKSISVFSEKGFNHATMKDVMTATGMSRGGVYAHFNNIDDLFLSVLQYIDDLPKNQLVVNPEQTALSNLFTWVDQSFTFTEASICQIGKALSEYFLAHTKNEIPYLEERRKKLTSQVENFIEAGIKSGEFKPTIDVKNFVELLLCQIDGILLNHYVNGQEEMNNQKLINYLKEQIKRILLK